MGILSEALSLPGPAGALEALLEYRGGNVAGAAVVCHPHPVYGGTMRNKVTHTLARAFVVQRFAALRFNFRGVGGSGGKFDQGRGELEDALVAVRQASERFPGLPLWLAGFSFGAAIAVRAASTASPAGLVAVAPAVSRIGGDSGPQPACPWLVIQGEDDEVVPADDTISWLNGLAPGPELQLFPGTGHFFHGKLVPLRAAVEAFIERQAGGHA